MLHEWGAVQMKQTDNLYYVEKVPTATKKTDIVYSLINALAVCNDYYEVTQPEYEEDLIFEI